MLPFYRNHDTSIYDIFGRDAWVELNDIGMSMMHEQWHFYFYEKITYMYDNDIKHGNKIIWWCQACIECLQTWDGHGSMVIGLKS